MPRKKWSQCEYCLKWIPSRFIAYHENTCKVRRGLEPRPELQEPEAETLEARPGESIQDLLNRASRLNKT